MVSPLVVVGLLVAAFVGFNIGGSSTGVAFGPAVGNHLVRKVTATVLFTLFALLGAWTVGRNVIDTMSDGIDFHTVERAPRDSIPSDSLDHSISTRCISGLSQNIRVTHRLPRRTRSRRQ